jgi:hypothetical protein
VTPVVYKDLLNFLLKVLLRSSCSIVTNLLTTFVSFYLFIDKVGSGKIIGNFVHAELYLALLLYGANMNERQRNRTTTIFENFFVYSNTRKLPWIDSNLIYF